MQCTTQTFLGSSCRNSNISWQSLYSACNGGARLNAPPHPQSTTCKPEMAIRKKTAETLNLPL